MNDSGGPPIPGTGEPNDPLLMTSDKLKEKFPQLTDQDLIIWDMFFSNQPQYDGAEEFFNRVTRMQSINTFSDPLHDQFRHFHNVFTHVHLDASFRRPEMQEMLKLKVESYAQTIGRKVLKESEQEGIDFDLIDQIIQSSIELSKKDTDSHEYNKPIREELAKANADGKYGIKIKSDEDALRKNPKVYAAYRKELNRQRYQDETVKAQIISSDERFEQWKALNQKIIIKQMKEIFILSLKHWIRSGKKKGGNTTADYVLEKSTAELQSNVNLDLKDPTKVLASGITDVTFKNYSFNFFYPEESTLTVPDQFLSPDVYFHKSAIEVLRGYGRRLNGLWFELDAIKSIEDLRSSGLKDRLINRMDKRPLDSHVIRKVTGSTFREDVTRFWIPRMIDISAAPSRNLSFTNWVYWIGSLLWTDHWKKRDAKARAEVKPKFNLEMLSNNAAQQTKKPKIEKQKYFDWNTWSLDTKENARTIHSNFVPPDLPGEELPVDFSLIASTDSVLPIHFELPTEEELASALPYKIVMAGEKPKNSFRLVSQKAQQTVEKRLWIPYPLKHNIQNIEVRNSTHVLELGRDYQILRHPKSGAFVVQLMENVKDANLNYDVEFAPDTFPQRPSLQTVTYLRDLDLEKIKLIANKLARDGLTQLADRIQSAVAGAQKKGAALSVEVLAHLIAEASAYTYIQPEKEGKPPNSPDSFEEFKIFLDEAGKLHMQCDAAGKLGHKISEQIFTGTPIEVSTRSCIMRKVGENFLSLNKRLHRRVYYQRGSEPYFVVDPTPREPWFEWLGRLSLSDVSTWIKKKWPFSRQKKQSSKTISPSDQITSADAPQHQDPVKLVQPEPSFKRTEAFLKELHSRIEMVEKSLLDRVSNTPEMTLEKLLKEQTRIQKATALAGSLFSFFYDDDSLDAVRNNLLKHYEDVPVFKTFGELKLWSIKNSAEALSELKKIYSSNNIKENQKSTSHLLYDPLIQQPLVELLKQLAHPLAAIHFGDVLDYWYMQSNGKVKELTFSKESIELRIRRIEKSRGIERPMLKKTSSGPQLKRACGLPRERHFR